MARLYILSPSCRLSSVYYGSVWSEINKLIDCLCLLITIVMTRSVQP